MAKIPKLRLSYSPISRKVYLTRMSIVKGIEMAVGDKIDVTPEALAAIYSYLMDIAVGEGSEKSYGVRGEGYIQWHRGERA